MLENVEGKGTVERARDRRRYHVMNVELDGPPVRPALVGIGDELRIEIDPDNRLHRLSDEPRRKSVSAADFEDTLTASEHLGDKLVAREREEHMSRIVVPGPRCGDSQTLDPSLANELHSLVIMPLASPERH